jgi:adenine-specific DNA-methyltransferase
MSAINDLIEQIPNPELRFKIRQEVDRMSKQKKFGLVFEEHLPECTPLYDHPIKKGSIVARKTGKVSDNFIVKGISDGKAECEGVENHETETIEVAELVCVARFGEPIYPYLKPIDSICNAPDSDLWHTLIEADNYHALQLLEYLYAGKVDCIYIDPPYNTGARDWKYNNDYVDNADSYRHSKWLSMMQKRLAIAKRLLNPRDSVLIVTIDEKEYLHLGCLLEDMFPEADIQMISSVIMPSGSSRAGRFGRADEYIFYCFIGNAVVSPWKTDMLRDNDGENVPVRWNGLIRNGEGSRRSRIPSLFYPIMLDKNTGELISVGDPIPPTMAVSEYEVPDGQIAMWPIDKSGNELMWRLYPPTLREYFQKGYAKLGKRDPITGLRPISYLQSGMIEKLENGQIRITGETIEGALELEYVVGGKTYAPLTVWNRVSHSAAEHGSGVIKRIIPGRHFSFPKSVYAEQDTLRFVVGNKPNALILDFFAGSGTTLHAVNLLNAEDGGHRRCIMVTNNEVSDEESKSLRRQGFQPGDEEWERLGIARYVNWPRTVCSIKGLDTNGKPLKGNYFGIDRPMSEGFLANAAYFKLGFLNKNAVALGRQFKELVPLLWMKSGAVGPCPSIDESIPDMLILPQNHFAVLIEEQQWPAFENAVLAQKSIKTVFIITDSESGYREMISHLNVENTYQLYRDYLDNFRINKGR